MEKIDTIIKALKIIATTAEIKPSDDMILDCAVRIYHGEKIQSSKGNTSATSPTEKQKTTMTNMKIPFDKDTTKKEASKLIGDKMAEWSKD